MGRLHKSCPHDLAHRIVDPLLIVHVQRGRQAPGLTEHHFGELGAAETAVELIFGTRQQSPEQDQLTPRVPEVNPQRDFHSGEQANNSEDRRRVDSLAEGFVVEADIAARDRRPKMAASLADSLDGLDQLGHDLRLFRIAEVQAIGRGHWVGSHDR